MDIEMYNCYFGDCFCLRSEEKAVYIDFGIHPSSLKGCKTNAQQLREDRHDKIAQIILNEKVSQDFLLTHYHEDHYSGLLYMIKYYKKHPMVWRKVFDKFYIPDIWNYPDYSMIAVCILEDILKNCKLSKKRRSYSLYELVSFFILNVKDIVFVKKGTELKFQDKCVALWPDLDILNIDAWAILEEYANGNAEFTRELLNIAQKLQYIVVENSEFSFQAMYEIIELTDGFIDKYSDSLTSAGNVPMQEEKKYIYLNTFANNISIVFQNREQCDSNYLFTGDITPNYMKKIENDTTYPLHKTFKYIKIPHHGTDRLYFDFTKYNPQMVLIPNGQCKTDSYKISKRYVDDFKDNVSVYCSNSNWCAENPNGILKQCKCKMPKRVYSKLSVFVK